MRKNLFKLLTFGFLALSSLSLAYARGGEFATVTIQNNLNVTYQLVDYTQSGNGFFSEEPNEVQSNGGDVTFTGDFYPPSYGSVSTAGFKLQPNNANCDDPRQQSGHCYEAQFTYSTYGSVPKVKLLDNSRPCLGSCRVTYDPNHPGDITVTITSSSKYHE
jgi:hypothetical protein